MASDRCTQCGRPQMPPGGYLAMVALAVFTFACGYMSGRDVTGSDVCGRYVHPTAAFEGGDCVLVTAAPEGGSDGP